MDPEVRRRVALPKPALEGFGQKVFEGILGFLVCDFKPLDIFLFSQECNGLSAIGSNQPPCWVEFVGDRQEVWF